MKSILITGATSGHGRYLAQQLKGHKLLLHGRNPEATKSLARELGAEALVADLSDLAQVQSLAAKVLLWHTRIDVLINNAGIGYGTERELSKDGYELRFAVMYLAPMLLSKLLLPGIKEQILNVGSQGQESLDFDDLMMERSYSGVSAYRRAKLALTMATFDLAAENPSLRVNIVHPASAMDTNMVRRGGGTPLHTVKYGGDATLKIMHSPLSGVYFNEDRAAQAHPDAYDPDLRAQLRSMTQAILGV